MGNVLTGSPIVLDTAGVTSAVAKVLRIQAIKWDANTGAGDTCILNDANGGSLVWQHTAAAANQGVHAAFSPSISVKGLYLQTLTSGKVLVYLASDYGG